MSDLPEAEKHQKEEKVTAEKEPTTTSEPETKHQAEPESQLQEPQVEDKDDDDNDDVVVTPKQTPTPRDEDKDDQPEVSPPTKADLDLRDEPAVAEAAPAVTTTSQKSPPAAAKNKNYIYTVKWIRFNKQELPIVMQNENGPCPLLSICNVLLLRQELELKREIEAITGDDIINKIADTLFNNFLPKWRDSDQQRRLGGGERLNLEKNIEDALEILQGLERGLDVNVRFSRADSFEYTKEMVVFDIFAINLYHGWVIDPQEVELNSVVGDLSYNQLVDKVITLKNNNKKNDDPDSNEAFLLDHFLECTASQLTYHGLAELHSLIKPNELGIFFRNNHFSTIHKSSSGRLFTLVTDAGFSNRSEVVWESLTNIEGDEVFCDSKFAIYNEEQHSDDERQQVPAHAQAHDEDYLLALALQRDQNDEQLAQIMQAEEEKKVRAASSQSANRTGGGARRSDNTAQEPPRSSSQTQKKDKKDSSCNIS